MTDEPAELDRRHLVEARHLAELHLERRGHRRGHHIGAGAGIERADLDRRVVDLGQRRERQEAVGDHADQHDRHHQQRRRHRPQDEQPRRVHAMPLIQRRDRTPLTRHCSGCCCPGPGCCPGPRLRWPGLCPGWPGVLPRCLARRLHHFDLGAVLQPVGAVGDDDLAGFKPLGDRDLLAVVGAERHRLHGHRVVGLDEVDEGARRAALDRRARHDRGALQRVDQQLHVDELVGEQVAARRWRNCARSFTVPVVVSIWLSIVASCPASSLVVPVRSNAVAPQRRAGMDLRQDRRQIVLGQGEDHRDRLHLGDDDDAVGVARLHVIAGIDLAQPDPAADRRDDMGNRPG